MKEAVPGEFEEIAQCSTCHGKGFVTRQVDLIYKLQLEAQNSDHCKQTQELFRQALKIIDKLIEERDSYRMELKGVLTRTELLERLVRERQK